MYSPWHKPSLFGLLVVLLASCATSPAVQRPVGYGATWLGGSPRVVARLDAGAVAAWAQVTQSREALKAVGDRTKVVWLGFDLASLDDWKTAADTVRVVLEGDFPRGAAGFMLDFNSAWKKGAEKGVWTNAALALSVSLPEDGLVAVRRHDALPAQPSPNVLRDLDPVALAGASVWVSFWEPGQALFGATGAKLLPVERLDVVLNAHDGVLEGPVILRFTDERSARAAAVLLKLFGPQVRARLGQDLDWSVEGSRIVGQTLRLQQSDLRSLAEALVADPPLTEAAP